MVVRLFDIAVKDDNAWAFTPRSITIEKSTVVRHQHERVRRGPDVTTSARWWVSMIEKAYVAAG